MSTQVISSLNKNYIGVVTGGNYSTVSDAGDLNKKADKVYVDQVESLLKDKVQKEANMRAEEDKVLKTSIEKVGAGLATKADKEVIKDILDELAMANIKVELEQILNQHIQHIHDACVRERAVMEKDMAAFKELSTQAEEEVGKRLQPVTELLQDLKQRVMGSIANLDFVEPLQQRIRALNGHIEILEGQVQQLAGVMDAKNTAIKGVVATELTLLMPQIKEEIEKERRKKRSFFSRLFSN